MPSTNFDRDKRRTGVDKEAFVASFISDGRIDEYPVDAGEILAENQADWDHAGRLDQQLEQQVLLVYERIGERSRVERAGRSLPSPRVVVTDLLGSMDGAEFCLLRQLPMPKVSVERVLAHLESLGFGLPQEMSIAVARITTMALLNSSKAKKP